jgi:hypothetical protein
MYWIKSQKFREKLVAVMHAAFNSSMLFLCNIIDIKVNKLNLELIYVATYSVYTYK